MLDTADRFDFSRKLELVPQKVERVLALDPVGALSVVYLDVNTDICNHRCRFCDGFYRTLKAASIPTERLLRLVDEMEEIGVLSVVLAGDRGEPLLHPGARELLARLAKSPIAVGLYTNGTVLPDELISPLADLAWIRISADAGSASVHQHMHDYPPRRDDFDRLLENLGRLSSACPEIGVSFVLDPRNLHEIELAADVMLSSGAHFIEYKPQYLPGYTVDGTWLRAEAGVIYGAIAAARERWGRRVVVNNQVAALLDGKRPPALRREPRRCLTSLLRLVVSTHGCYACTPFRGEAERYYGDILSQSLREVLTSPVRTSLIHRRCARVCAYDAQNDRLLAMSEGQAAPSTGPIATLRSQDRFL